MSMQWLHTRQRWTVIVPFLTVVGLLAALGMLSVDILSSVRAFVGGESLWSKGQKDAVHHLARYTESRAPEDYRKFQASLAVPLGDRIARLELDKGEPDLDLVRAAFVQGGNHPDDIPGMIRLYRRFGEVSFMAEAIAIWAEGDRGIAELSELAERAHRLIASGDRGSGDLRALLARISALNERLTELERRFSAKLGEASRTAQQIVVLATLSLAAILAFVGVLLTLHVLRAQSRSEQALRASNERFALAAAAADIGVFDWDVQRRRVAVDVRAAAFYGLRLDRPGIVSTRLTRSMTHPDDLPAVRAALRKAIADRAPLAIRYRVCLPGATVRHIELNGRASQRGVAREPHMTGILSDVTEEMRSDELRRDKEAAEQANRAKTQFLSRVSHELRTPLNAILGFAQLIEGDPKEPPTRAQATRIGHVLASGQQLLGLINDVLDFSSIDQGAVTLAAREIDLVPLVRGCLERAEPLTLAHRIRLAFDAPTVTLPAFADPLRLEQVLVNLVSNAIKYNRPGGRVEVSLTRGEADDVIAVRDTGIGLSEAQRAQLFEPFNRLGAEYSRVPGSGLGLVITRQLVERMGGRLEVESVQGEGSTFTLRLPRTRQAPAPPAAGDATPKAQPEFESVAG